MTYIEMLNGFGRWTEVNKLTASAQLLWLRLLMTFNSSGWPSEAAVSNISLADKCSFSEKNVQRARAELKAAGLIDYTSGGGGTKTRYRLREELFQLRPGARIERKGKTAWVDGGGYTEVRSKPSFDVDEITRRMLLESPEL